METKIERQRFIDSLGSKLIADFGCGCLAEGFESDTFNHPGVQFFYEGWLAAKHDAKPVVEIHTTNYKWHGEIHRVVYGETVLASALTLDHAKDWIEANGYRLE